MSKMLHCIAIDDEPPALDLIGKFCERAGDIELHTYTDPAQGLDAIRRMRPQLVFLDIEMGTVNGVEIASQLPPGTCFIFTTAYLDYAHEGFNLDAVDYLHKPFAYSRFETALARARRRLDSTAAPAQQSIVVKQAYNNVAIPLDDIVYVEAMEGYSKIYRRSAPCVVSRVILKNIGAMLPESEFVRIHRSFIVAKSKVANYNKQEVRTVTGVTLPVGRQYANAVVEALHS